MCNLHWWHPLQPFQLLTLNVKRVTWCVCYHCKFYLKQLGPKYTTIGLFEAIDTSGVVMVLKMQQLHDMFSFTWKVVAWAPYMYTT
jgi:hypothetical protein